ncbi:MAG: hypothetical protein Q7T18_05275, partial [Sedimentisphaerales bacterium]|nr:hypothetical protein [Sedimentisphaerales bacterium]
MVRSICSLRSHAVWCAFLFVIAFLSPALVGAAEDTEKAASLRSVSVQLIDVGAEQLRRGAYSAAQKSLEQANENRQYLSESERKNLDEMLKKTQAVSVERERIYEKMQTAAASAKSKDYSRAISALSFIQDSPYLTKVERTQVQIDLAAYKGELKSRQQEVAGLFAKSITLYNEGELDNARKGFEQVASSGVPLVSTGPTAKEYIAKIDEQKAQASAASPVVAETTPAVAEDELLNAKTTAPPVAEAKAPVAPAPAAEFTPEAQPAADAQTTGCVTTQATAQCAPVEGSYVDKVMQQRNVQRSYTEAVVDDALAKARSQTRQGDFAAARNSIYAAWRVVDNNKLLLGDDLYKKMNDALDSVKSEIDAGDAALTASERQQKQTDAVALQRQLRSQQDTERSQRIDDLMNKALALQREQRYEDARGQLELLLAIDPHNEHALTMHQTLTDMINFRKQLEVRKEIDEQTNETFLNSDKSTIPYADEIKYPRDWRDIVSKRDSAQGGGISEASTKVNRQLSETVDLSKLTPDTAFGDAVVMLQNSVQPMLQVVVRWPDLQENADITRLTRINMDPVSAISLRKALEELLSSVSGGGITLGYVIDESGVITIATKASLPSKLTQRAYDISDLLGIPADFFSDMTQTGLGQTQQAATAGGGGGGGGQRQQQQSQNQQQLSSQELRQQSQTRMSDVIAMIQTIQPESWQTTGPGSVTVWGNSLVVLQTAEIHQQIEEMIEK